MKLKDLYHFISGFINSPLMMITKINLDSIVINKTIHNKKWFFLRLECYFIIHNVYYQEKGEKLKKKKNCRQEKLINDLMLRNKVKFPNLYNTSWNHLKHLSNIRSPPSLIRNVINHAFERLFLHKNWFE